MVHYTTNNGTVGHHERRMYVSILHVLLQQSSHDILQKSLEHFSGKSVTGAKCQNHIFLSVLLSGDKKHKYVA
jgi:hypothetical protein